MIIYLLHLIIGILYISLFPSNIFLIGILYFVFLIPPLHRTIVYYIVEFKLPPWFIVLKCIVHVSLFDNYHQKINIMFLWMIVYTWNDLLFVVRHAENRISKINDLLYNHDMRIAHLYINTYTEDKVNRFHNHLFDTNSLYWFDKTSQSNKVSLGIQNYRKILVDSSPIHTDPTLLKAAKGHSIFLRNKVFIYMPAVFIFMYAGFIDFRWHYLTVLNMIIVYFECMQLLLTTKQFYIYSNIVLFVCVFLANYQRSVYLIQPI